MNDLSMSVDTNNVPLECLKYEYIDIKMQYSKGQIS